MAGARERLAGARACASSWIDPARSRISDHVVWLLQGECRTARARALDGWPKYNTSSFL
jgi:hypothetical protein